MKKALILTAALLIMAGCSTKEPSAEAAFLSKLSQYRGFRIDYLPGSEILIQNGGRKLYDPDDGSSTPLVLHFKRAMSDNKAEYSVEGASQQVALEITEPTVTVFPPNQAAEKYTLYK